MKGKPNQHPTVIKSIYTFARDFVKEYDDCMTSAVKVSMLCLALPSPPLCRQQQQCQHQQQWRQQQQPPPTPPPRQHHHHHQHHYHDTTTNTTTTTTTPLLPPVPQPPPAPPPPHCPCHTTVHTNRTQPARFPTVVHL